ncbi:MAG TPA: FAD-binding oxidoreductase [Candidatus Paceibacterota bacterium]|jgi:FAD/FMN-containing dehydrogenase|nr:FAD-binding oxidoreductase [Candidatus Paceibacterota bacterium]
MENTAEITKPEPTVASVSAAVANYAVIKDDISKFFKGDIDDSAETLDKYSRDASLLEVRPKLVVFPKDSADIQALVKYVNEKKSEYPDLSITARAAGSDMSGGPLNESIILEMCRYMHGFSFEGNVATVLPGTFYRDFEPETLKRGLILPSYTASKSLNTVGGMVANNSAGEKTLSYGKTDAYVREIKAVFSDGNEYVIKPLSQNELEVKIRQGGFEGEIYRKISLMLRQHHDEIMKAKPNVSKNSSGYALWNIEQGDLFDLTRLITGSQGTLCIITEAKLELVPVKPKSKLMVIFLRDIRHVSDLVNEILPFKPESLESFDDKTMQLAIKFMPSMAKKMKAGLLKLMWSFWPEALMVLTGGLPKLIILVEFGGNNDAEIDAQLDACAKKIKHFGFKTRVMHNPTEAEKYWTIRRESFNLLRQHVHGRRTAPFIDDIIVRPEFMPEFVPQVTKILDDYKLVYTIAGHAGNGNFHIIPLMDMHHPENRDVIMEVSEKIYDLVVKYHGSITAEHNDGIVRTPYLLKVFGPEMVKLFKETQDIFDPQDIFNPGKKSNCTLQYFHDHIATEK